MTEAVLPEVQPPPLWRRLLPIALAVGLVAFVLARIDHASFLRAVRSTHYVWFSAFAFTFNLSLLAADTWATTWIYRRTVGPVRAREFFVVRGASYLPALLNHHIGQGWVTYFVSRAYGAPLWRVAGATLAVYATTFAGVMVLFLAAVPLAYREVPVLAPVVGAVVVGGLAYLALLGFAPRLLAKREATAVLAELGVRGHLEGVLRRMPHVLAQFLGTWGAFWFFDVRVPVAAALAFVPVLMLASTLPLTPAGIGTRDVVSVQFFSRYAPGVGDERAAVVAACTLSWVTVLILIQLGCSPFFLRAARVLMARAAAAPARATPP